MDKQKKPKKKKIQYEYKKIKKYKREQVIIIGLLCICFISFAPILGRYVTNSFNNYYLRTKEFYFNSDKLQENSASYQIENWSGVDDYIITINMDSRNNNILATSYDIDYEISYVCSENIICELSKQEGTIKESTHTDFFTIKITPNAVFNTNDRVWVEITAKSTTAYEKTLKATFTLVVGQEKLSYDIQDKENNPYLNLKITNTISYYQVQEAFGNYRVGDKLTIEQYLALDESQKQRCYSAIAIIEFDPQEVLLDMTNQEYINGFDIQTVQINGTNYIKAFKFKIDAISSANIKFYKVNINEDYTYKGQGNSIIRVTSR